MLSAALRSAKTFLILQASLFVQNLRAGIAGGRVLYAASHGSICACIRNMNAALKGCCSAKQTGDEASLHLVIIVN